MKQYNEQRQGIQAEMDAALVAKDMPKYNELNAKFQKGDFGGSSFALGGLNPFASRTGGSYQQDALTAQKALQGKYNTAMGKVGPQSGDAEAIKAIEDRLGSGELIGPQAEAMEKQLKFLKERYASKPGAESPEAIALRVRMEAAKPSGMRFTPWKPPGGATASTAGNPTGNWNLGGRPIIPGHRQGFTPNPYDYRTPPNPGEQPPAYFNFNQAL
jgi:hypothetical protein